MSLQEQFLAHGRLHLDLLGGVMDVDSGSERMHDDLSACGFAPTSTSAASCPTNRPFYPAIPHYRSSAKTAAVFIILTTPFRLTLAR